MYENGFQRPVDQAPTRQHRSSGREIVVTNADNELGWSNGDRIDLHRFLTGLSPAVYLMQIAGNTMRPSGLYHGQYAVVDRSIKPFDGCLAVVRFNGGLVVRRLRRAGNNWQLVPDDPREKTLTITKNDMVERIGVVKAAMLLYPNTRK